MVAGPNGSGKSTLMRRLAADYAVNFYDVINADDIYAEVKRTGAYAPSVPVDSSDLYRFAMASSYGADVKLPFMDGKIDVKEDCIVFSADSVNSYTVALVATFLQHEYIRERHSFSQESVFSHKSKIDALREAGESGFRTYLYFVATEDPAINVARVESRGMLGGHSVPAEKIESRFPHAVANAAAALPNLSRAYFFDNSGETMRFFAEWDRGSGLILSEDFAVPKWFAPIAEAAKGLQVSGGSSHARMDSALAAPAAAASRDAIAEAFAAGLSVTVMRDGRIVRVSPTGTEEIVDREVKG